MDISICSFSFHRLLEAGKQDMFRYITDCKELGCTYLDPWNAHLAGVQDAEMVKKAGTDPEHAKLPPQDDEYLTRVKRAADAVGLPFGCVAVDGAHIYEETEEARKANRALAYRWLEICGKLGAKQIRIDAGGPAEMPDHVFAVIIDGYKDLIARAKSKGIELLIENHWGPSNIPENLMKILKAAPGLGLLFDTNNWKGDKEKAWETFAPYARATHFKTFVFDEQGNETTVDIPKAVRILKETGYKGCWGIESCPQDGDEYAGVRKTIALLRRLVEG